MNMNSVLELLTDMTSLTEISLIVVGLNLLLAAPMLFFISKFDFRTAGKAAATGIGIALLGLASPSIISLVFKPLSDHLGIASFLEISGLIAIAVLDVAAFFLPLAISFKRHNKVGGVITVSLLGMIIPFMWPVALSLALSNNKKMELITVNPVRA
jgi:hypothetical protein